MASVGASARAAGNIVCSIDLRQLSGFEEFEEKIKVSDADVFGLSVSIVDQWPALMCAHLIKKHRPECKVIAGGQHPTIFPERYNINAIDSVVMGEGEVTFVDLLGKVERGESLPRQVKGERPDLDKIPWAARDLFDSSKELYCQLAPDQKTPSVTMVSGRGCPFHCTYCQPTENAVFGKPNRSRSPENVVGELQILKRKHNFNSVTFWDDSFTFNSKWVDRFSDLFEKENFKASITACTRADLICNHEGMIERLASIGLNWVAIGLESGSQRLLDFIKKGTTVEQNLQAARICRKYGIKVYGAHMYGIPTETREDSLATLKMMETINPEHNSPFLFLPIEGTEIYKYCEENDLILPNVKERTIARTGVFIPSLKGIDYEYIRGLITGTKLVKIEEQMQQIGV